MLFSLIIPVYGVEKYIAKCVESCCIQEGINYTEYELIIVNDKSPDNSILIASETLKNYPNINYRIIERERNGGLSAARNSGMRKASGKYIWFIDSDDYISPESLFILKNAIEKFKQPEIISFGYTRVYPSFSESHAFVQSTCVVKQGIEFLKNHSFLSACDKIYKNSFLSELGLKFIEGMIWEDGEFNIKALSKAKSHVCLPDSLYFYLARQGSISKNGAKVSFTLTSDLKKFDSIFEWMRGQAFNRDELEILALHNFKTLIFYLAGIPQLPSRERSQYFRKFKDRKNHIKDNNSFLTNHKYKLLNFFILKFTKPLSYLLNARIMAIHKREQQKFNQ